MQAKYGEDVLVIGVAGRDDLEPIQDFITNLDVGGFNHVADEDLVVWKEYGIRSQPSFAFINDDGVVEVQGGSMGVDGLSERIDALIAS